MGTFWYNGEFIDVPSAVSEYAHSGIGTGDAPRGNPGLMLLLPSTDYWGHTTETPGSLDAPATWYQVYPDSPLHGSPVVERSWGFRRGRVIVGQDTYTADFTSRVAQLGAIEDTGRVSVLVYVPTVQGTAPSLTLTLRSGATPAAALSGGTVRHTLGVTAPGMYQLDTSGPVTHAYWGVTGAIAGTGAGFQVLVAIARLNYFLCSPGPAELLLVDSLALVSPQDGATEVQPEAQLEWAAVYAPLTFDVYFGNSNPPPLVSSGQAASTYNPPGDLAPATTYYWKIVAHGAGGDTTGPVWSFISSTEETMTLDHDVTVTDVVNTTTETTVYSFTVPGGTLSTDRALRLSLIGDYLNNSGADPSSFHVKVKYGTAVLSALFNPQALYSSSLRRAIQVDVLLSAANATGSQTPGFG